MSRHFLGVVILAAFVATSVRAEEPKIAQLSATTATPIDLSAGQVTATPEMWFYTQELRRYDDPRNAIREQAAIKTANATHDWLPCSGTASPTAAR